VRPANLLLDTHVFIWWMADDGRLRDHARAAIAGAEIVFVSLASAWETAIKVAIGRLRLPAPFESGVVGSGFEPLPIAFAHCERAARLPNHHRDQFDRMLVAQAQTEALILVTHDARLADYDVALLQT